VGQSQLLKEFLERIECRKQQVGFAVVCLSLVRLYLALLVMHHRK